MKYSSGKKKIEFENTILKRKYFRIDKVLEIYISFTEIYQNIHSEEIDSL